jgi:hypothetical protein
MSALGMVISDGIVTLMDSGPYVSPNGRIRSLAAGDTDIPARPVWAKAVNVNRQERAMENSLFPLIDMRFTP